MSTGCRRGVLPSSSSSSTETSRSPKSGIGRVELPEKRVKRDGGASRLGVVSRGSMGAASASCSPSLGKMRSLSRVAATRTVDNSLKAICGPSVTSHANKAKQKRCGAAGRHSGVQNVETISFCQHNIGASLMLSSAQNSSIYSVFVMN